MGLAHLQKRPQRAPFTFLPYEGTGRRPLAIYEQGIGTSPDTRSVGALILDSPGSRTMRNKFLSFINYPVYCILLQLSDWIETLIYNDILPLP